MKRFAVMVTETITREAMMYIIVGNNQNSMHAEELAAKRDLSALDWSEPRTEVRLSSACRDDGNAIIAEKC